jgi:hypothetical protein
MHRNSVAMALLLTTLTVGLAASAPMMHEGVRAAGSTPLAVARDSRLATGYPILRITVTDDDIIAPGSVAAGRTLIAYENKGQELRQSWLVRVPDDLTAAELAAPAPAGMPPAWFFRGTFVGFPGAVQPGAVSYAVVDLVPGIYGVFDDFTELFTVTASAAEGATPTARREPVADGDVTMFDYGFRFPERVVAGDRIWKVTNVGREVHELVLAKSPEPITKEQVLDLIMAGDAAATPTGGGPSLNDLEAGEATGFGALSPGHTGWTELTLEPGVYVAICFVPDANGTPHLALGMIQVFTVI